MPELTRPLPPAWRRKAQRSTFRGDRSLSAGDVLRHERIDLDACRPGRAVLVMALEINRGLVARDAARLAQQEARHFGRIGRPRIDDHAIAALAVRECQRAAALDPTLGVIPRG